MPNPVDSAPRQPGPIALPSDPEALPAPASTPTPTPLQRFHRRLAYSALAALVIVSLVLVEHPPRIGRGDDELFIPIEIDQDYRPWPGLSRARDERLDRYWTPTSPGVQHCAEWTRQDDGTVTAAFALPAADPELTFLLSRAPVHGRVRIIEDEDSRVPFTVNVSASHEDPEKLAQLKACQVHHHEYAEQGVMFWAPSEGNAEYDSDVRVDVILSVPRTSGGEEYRDLSTQLSRFDHVVGELFHFFSGTKFRTIRLRTRDADMNFGSIIADTAFIESMGGDTQGFVAIAGSGELDIRTSNGVINMTAMMFGWESPRNESRVDVWTSNGAIHARIALVSDFPDNLLNARLHTSNAALSLQARMMAENSTMRIDAETSNGPASVLATDGFEGRYELRTSNADARLDVNPNAYDPTGRGRERVVRKEEEGDSEKKGMIYWQDKDAAEVQEGSDSGLVRVRTSNGPVVLQV
ncbi:hypothetical protein HMN09_00139300 [Mycena chlorophos]|uniref:Uncharacterized protein n=1 Tax=Mycena chlorophos TaxID=658473 RepID=A0A8H6WMV1_MYCCL|nr:hypothetical protein HMN09_00139300 [Mycena chlorophos]